MPWRVFCQQLKIRSSGSVVNFNPYNFQEDLIELITTSPNTLVLKSRQMGISETLCSYLLWRAITEPGFTGVVISKTQQDSSDLAVRIRRMASSLDKCPDMNSESKTELSFNELGNIKFLPGTARSARGIPSASVLWFDEAAYITDIEDIYQSAVPTLSMVGTNAKVIFNSTPNGKSGLFYELWQAPDRPDWSKIELHYEEHPRYQPPQEWAARTRLERNLTESQWSQEYELDFAESERNVFDEELVRRAARGQYQSPVVGNRYLMGIDPNFSGGDYFTCTVWDVSKPPYNLVALYHERKQSSNYSISHCIRLIQAYKPYLVNIETNSGGNVLLEELAQRQPAKYGSIITSRPSKITNTDQIILLLEKDFLTYPNNSEWISEFISFQQTETGARQAPSGKHDDLVMSTAVAFAGFKIPQTWNIGQALFQ